jgi:hypothetical protein
VTTLASTCVSRVGFDAAPKRTFRVLSIVAQKLQSLTKVREAQTASSARETNALPQFHHVDLVEVRGRFALNHPDVAHF